MNYEPEKTPGGRDYLKIATFGNVTLEDVEDFSRVIGPGQKYASYPILSTIAQGSDFSAQARKRFSSLGDKARVEDRVPTAVVVTNVPLRVLLMFIVKVAGASESTQFFGKEDAARTWLYSRLDD